MREDIQKGKSGHNMRGELVGGEREVQKDARFKVFTVVKIQVDVFWVVVSCIVAGYQDLEDHAASIFRVMEAA
jgi:hypothetical protein